MSNLALFDFDKTIINKDTGLCFILYALKKNFFRLILAMIAAPLAFTFFISNRLRFIGNSIFLWIATAGLSESEVDKLREDFVHDYLNSPDTVVYQDAQQKIDEHSLNGDQIYIVSGASTWMLEKIIHQLNFHSEVKVLGSNEHRFLGGMVSNFHCFGENKLKVLAKHLQLKNYSHVVGYSDSSSDIPFLSICHKKFIVNPTSTSLSKIRKAIDSDMTILNWA